MDLPPEDKPGVNLASWADEHGLVFPPGTVIGAWSTNFGFALRIRGPEVSYDVDASMEPSIEHLTCALEFAIKCIASKAKRAAAATVRLPSA